MNAVRSETRAACCMLCVTMMIVIVARKLVHQLLDLLRADRVERRGRLVEQENPWLGGERARDAEALLLAAGECRSRSSEVGPSPRPRAPARCKRIARRSRRSRVVTAPFAARTRSPAATLSRIDIVGNGVGRWNTMPMWRRTAIALVPRRRCRVRRGALRRSTRAPGTVSCMRLRQRRSVDLPQPDGPMIAVTRPLSHREIDVSNSGVITEVCAEALCSKATETSESAAVAACRAGRGISRGATIARDAGKSPGCSCGDLESTSVSSSIEYSMASVDR